MGISYTQIRGFAIMLNEEKMRGLLNLIDRRYKIIQICQDKEVKRILKSYTDWARNMSKLSLFAGCMVQSMFYLFPFASSERNLPFAIWVFGVDLTQSFLYEFLFIAQTVIAIPAGFYYVSFNCFWFRWLHSLLLKLKSFSNA